MPVSQLCLHSGAGTAAKLCHLPATDHGAVSCAGAQLCPVSARGSLPYFRSGLPAVCHLQPQPITTYTWTATHLHIAALQTPGPRLHQDLATVSASLSLSGLRSVSSLQLQSVSPTGASPVPVCIYSLCMYYVYGINTHVLRPHLERGSSGCDSNLV